MLATVLRLAALARSVANTIECNAASAPDSVNCIPTEVFILAIEMHSFTGKVNKMSIEFLERSQIIEKCSEFMLAYAAQGLADDQGSSAGAQLRGCLTHSVEALAGLPETCIVALKNADLEPAQKYLDFVALLDRDARDAAAALELVLAQPSISSKLVANLNACIQLRALLTDLLLLGEILRTRGGEGKQKLPQGNAA